MVSFLESRNEFLNSPYKNKGLKQEVVVHAFNFSSHGGTGMWIFVRSRLAWYPKQVPEQL